MRAYGSLTRRRRNPPSRRRPTTPLKREAGKRSVAASASAEAHFAEGTPARQRQARGQRKRPICCVWNTTQAGGGGEGGSRARQQRETQGIGRRGDGFQRGLKRTNVPNVPAFQGRIRPFSQDPTRKTMNLLIFSLK